MTIRELLTLLLIFVLGTSNAQKETRLGLYFNNYKASEAFADNITRNPIGVAFSYMKKYKSSLIYGVEVGMGLYSGKKYFYETVDEGVPDNFVRLYEENGFFSYQGVLRYLLVKDDAFTPYVEVKAGASTFFSAIRAMQVSEVFDDGFHIHETALNAGIGGGLTIELGNPSWRRQLLLDLSAIHQWGSNVRYRNSKKNILVDSFAEGYRSSKTNAIHYKVGFVMVF